MSSVFVGDIKVFKRWKLMVNSQTVLPQWLTDQLISQVLETEGERPGLVCRQEAILPKSVGGTI